MSIGLTFKEYLKSKEELRAAVKETPQQVCEYTISKYCKLVVGESKDDKELIILKPNQKVIVEWLYNDIDNPTPVNITFEGVCPIVDAANHNSYWQPQKLQKWLHKNTVPKNPFI